MTKLVVQALEQVHKAGFAHKDVKVCNCHFGMSTDGAPILKLLDFGAAIYLPGGLS